MAMLFNLINKNKSKSIKKELGFLDTDEEMERRESRNYRTNIREGGNTPNARGTQNVFSSLKSRHDHSSKSRSLERTRYKALLKVQF